MHERVRARAQPVVRELLGQPLAWLGAQRVFLFHVTLVSSMEGLITSGLAQAPPCLIRPMVANPVVFLGLGHRCFFDKLQCTTTSIILCIFLF